MKSISELVDWKESKWKKQYQADPRIKELFMGITELERLNFYETIILNPYIPVVPFYNQIQLLCSSGHVLYGGARGGGKTEASIMGALQYTAYPEWKAGIFRLTFSDLSLPGAIMDRALEWLQNNKMLIEVGLAPSWDNGKKVFSFPSGAKVFFGHVQHEKDADKYQGSEFHHLIFDEAVQFSESKLTKIKGSNRKKSNDPLPLRVWYTGNPGGVSHDYFHKKFVEGPETFIDSKYKDNPYLNHKKYESVFREICDSDPVLYRQWKYGDWKSLPQGALFKREWFTKHLYEEIKEPVTDWLRFWDLAATKEVDDTRKGGADWSVGGLFALGESGKVYLHDIVRMREDEDVVWDTILETAHNDGAQVRVRIEQEGAASGKMVIGRLARDLPGFDVDGQSVPRKSKIDRARSWISFIKYGRLYTHDSLDWLSPFLNEITAFPTKGVHDDQVDVLSGGLNALINKESRRHVIDWKLIEKLNK